MDKGRIDGIPEESDLELRNHWVVSMDGGPDLPPQRIPLLKLELQAF